MKVEWQMEICRSPKQLEVPLRRWDSKPKPFGTHSGDLPTDYDTHITTTLSPWLALETSFAWRKTVLATDVVHHASLDGEIIQKRMYSVHISLNFFRLGYWRYMFY